MIGVFDSGIGGLTVLREITRQLPAHGYIYFADTGFTPYGEKTANQIIERSFLITETLIKRGARIIVVACNTATAFAVDKLREQFDIPIVAMEPAVKPGVLKSKIKKVGILATTMTLASRRYMSLLERFATEVEVIEQPCPGLVEQVEKLETDSDITRRLLHQYLDPLLVQGVDTVVLGCTHYPLLKNQILDIVDEKVEIIDTAKAVTEELKRKIDNLGIPPSNNTVGTFITTGDKDFFKKQLNSYWHNEVSVESINIPG